MRYIRTKDGRILDLDRIKRCAESYSFNNKSETHLSVEWDIIREEIDILKQADTIEELCDRYYGVDKEGDIDNVYNWSKDAYPIKPHEWAINGFCTKENIKISELKKIYPKGIFGAIVWFDYKGNLHIDIVAKMNEKGELELL